MGYRLGDIVFDDDDHGELRNNDNNIGNLGLDDHDDARNRDDHDRRRIGNDNDPCGGRFDVDDVRSAQRKRRHVGLGRPVFGNRWVDPSVHGLARAARLCARAVGARARHDAAGHRPAMEGAHGTRVMSPSTVVTAPPVASAPSVDVPSEPVRSSASARGVVPLRATIVALGIVAIAFVAFIVIGSSLRYHAAQRARFARLRSELAQGTAPVSPVDAHGHLLALGTPIALLKIPSLGMNVVVGEGTTPGALALGPGHLRSTIFPGGAGTSVVLGRQAAYGGPFHAIATLKPGATITVTTGEGIVTFRVRGVRKPGDPIPALSNGAARLTLVTATGHAYMPTGTVDVDADSVGNSLSAASPPLQTVPASERPLGTDTSSLFKLVLWLELLLALAVGAVWTWHRRSAAHAWVIFTAPVLLVATEVVGEVSRLLPNLL